MAGKRFKTLDAIRDALMQGNVDPNTLPSNLDYVHYMKYRNGDIPERTITRPSLGNDVPVGVIAFGLDDTDPLAKIQVPWNERAQTFYNGLGNNNLFGLELATLTDYNENISFVPAKVRIQAKGNGVADSSDLTGRRYKKNNNPSYTIPLGQTGTVKHFQAAVQGLLDSSIGAGYHISVDPEEWRRV